MSRWGRFILERFPPLVYLPMVAVFIGADLAIAERFPAPVTWSLALTAAIVVSFFFRLRLFDEIKDLDVDRQVNPDRPLARGLIAVPEVKVVIGVLTVAELAGALFLGTPAGLAHGLAVAFSFAMYNEFFVGDWLRPRLTTYAVTHTFSSAMLGWSVAAQQLNVLPWQLPAAVIWFGLVNWTVFNVFEFARKTFAPEGERAHVESYSQVFGPRGAAALCVSQVLVALAVVVYITDDSSIIDPVLIGISGLFAAIALAYAAKPTPAFARGYRGASAAYIVCFLGALAVWG